MDSRSQFMDSRSQFMDSWSQFMDSWSQFMDSRSQFMDSRSQFMDSRSQFMASWSPRTDPRSPPTYQFRPFAVLPWPTCAAGQVYQPQPLEPPPERTYNCGNVGYLLSMIAAARAAGLRFDELLRREAIVGG